MNARCRRATPGAKNEPAFRVSQRTPKLPRSISEILDCLFEHFVWPARIPRIAGVTGTSGTSPTRCSCLRLCSLPERRRGIGGLARWVPPQLRRGRLPRALAQDAHLNRPPGPAKVLCPSGSAARGNGVWVTRRSPRTFSDGKHGRVDPRARAREVAESASGDAERGDDHSVPVREKPKN